MELKGGLMADEWTVNEWHVTFTPRTDVDLLMNELVSNSIGSICCRTGLEVVQQQQQQHSFTCVLDMRTQNGDEPVGEITFLGAKLPF